MSNDTKLEDKILMTEKKLKEFSIILHRFDQQYQELLEQLALTPDELKEYANNPENFSPLLWEQLQNEKKQADEKLLIEINNIPDPIKTKKNLSEKGNIQQHWLFVR